MTFVKLKQFLYSLVHHIGSKQMRSSMPERICLRR